MANAPPPNTTVQVLEGLPHQFSLPWRRWFQSLSGTSASGTPGPPGPEGPSGPAGPAGPVGPSDGSDLLALLGLTNLDGSTAQISIGLAAPVEFVVSGSPVTGIGTLTLTKATESANTVWAGPTSGAAAQPTFRSLVASDLPGSSGAPVTFTPTITFATPGDLSVAYAGQSGAYVQVGPMVLIWYQLTFTPTYTTASGNFLISSPPVAPTNRTWAWPLRSLSSPTWPGGPDTMVNAINGASGINLASFKSGTATNLFTTTQIVSGVACTVNFSGFYY